jgi:hypothetical protein
MITLAKDSYIRATGNGKDFNIEIDPLVKTSLNYYQASVEAAKEIEANRHGPLYMMYSGGVDSEYALNVFLSQGINITPVIVKLAPSYNLFDIGFAHKLCSNKGLTPLVIDIDYDKFVTKGSMLELAVVMKSKVYHYVTTAYAIGKLDGTVICGDGEPYIRKDVNTGGWNVHIDEHDYALPNFYRIMGVYGTPHFNRYTPAMMRSFMETQRMRDLASNSVEGKLGSHSSKWLIYNQHSNFNLQQRPKFHGYEKIDSSKIKQHESFAELEKLGQQWNGVWEEGYTAFMDRVCVQ